MEAFKLLSRATNLKPAPNSERRGLHVPSEGKSGASAVGVERTGFNPSRVINSGKKRKRDATQLVEDQAETTDFSVLNKSTVVPQQHEESFQPGSHSIKSEILERSTPEECRSIFKSHKVKIAPLVGDLNSVASETINDSRKARGDRKASNDDPVSRKKQKEALKLYTQPLTSFALLKTFYNGPRALSNNIQDQGYVTPTEVQLATIPLLLDPVAAGLCLPSNCHDIDLLTIAPTGSGKTLAFLIPLITHLVRNHHEGKASISSRHVSALIVAPTKELVGQIVNEGRKLCQSTGVSITAMRKGMHIATQSDGSIFQNRDEKHSVSQTNERSLFIRADILVTTPLLLANTIREDKTDLSSVRYLILDEADVLLDPLFRDQTLSLWTACNNPSLRLTLWSATIGSNIEELVIQLIKERQTRLGIKDQTPLLRCIIGLKDSALPTISHKLIYAAIEPGKLLGLRQLLHPSSTGDGTRTAPLLRPPFLVFTQTIERAIALHAELLYDIPIEAGGSSRLAVLHSDLSDSKRSDIMARFRKGQIWILITTDLLSRGIDFRGVNGVVNYDIPTSSAAYVHRAGRTGRAGREGGVAVTFYTREDVKYVKAIANAIAASEKARGQAAKVEDGEDEGVQKWLLNALPDISKKDRQELKKRGVDVRRKIRAGENDKEAKAKRNARISTKSGYGKRLENNRKGAIEATQSRHDETDDDGAGSDAWSGFDE